MGIKTGKIVYNVRERGRKFIGKDRNLDTRALAAIVNGNEVQERVRNRDLHGFYGHIFRMKYGIQPPEMVIEDGKTVYLEPALVTTHLKADNDGNIEHEAEFLDTAAGEMAERCFNSRKGGFSSAIFAKPNGPVDVPLVFAGFDFVFEPNFTTNRGYMLDSTGAGFDGMMLDAVMADWTQGMAAMKAMYDSISREHELAITTMAKMAEENEELFSILAKRGTSSDGGVIVLDSTGDEQTRPMVVSRAATRAFIARANSFSAAACVGFEKPAAEPTPDDPVLAAAKHQYGV